MPRKDTKLTKSVDSEAKVQREENIFVQATCANKGQVAAMADNQVSLIHTYCHIGCVAKETL